MKPFTTRDWWTCAEQINAMLPPRCAAAGVVWDSDLAEKLYRQRRRKDLKSLYRELYDRSKNGPARLSEDTEFRLYEVVFEDWHGMIRVG